MSKYKRRTPLYDIREWYGRYSKWVLIMKGGTLLQWYSRALDRFFAMYPKYRGLEQFTSIDIADYRLVRQRAGMTPLTIEKEVQYIRFFWRWLIEDKGLPLHNIARLVKSNIKPWPKGDFKVTGKLTLEQATRVLEECQDVRAKRHILFVMKGGGCTPRPQRLRDDIYTAAHRAGVVGFRISQLKLRAQNRLAQDIVHSYCNKILDSLTIESQSASNSLTTVEVPTSDKGASVQDSDNNRMPISRILEQQLGTEG